MEFVKKLTNVQFAYIAGFLDEDGSINAQIVRRSDYVLKFQIRVTITFFQKTSKIYFLKGLDKLLGLGSIRNRSDLISEYTIVGFKNCNYLLTKIYPFLHIKKKQAWYMLKIIKIFEQNKKINAPLFIKICKIVDRFGLLNDSKKRIINSKIVYSALKDKL